MWKKTHSRQGTLASSTTAPAKNLLLEGPISHNNERKKKERTRRRPERRSGADRRRKRDFSGGWFPVSQVTDPRTIGEGLRSLEREQWRSEGESKASKTRPPTEGKRRGGFGAPPPGLKNEAKSFPPLHGKGDEGGVGKTSQVTRDEMPSGGGVERRKKKKKNRPYAPSPYRVAHLYLVGMGKKDH